MFLKKYKKSAIDFVDSRLVEWVNSCLNLKY